MNPTDVVLFGAVALMVVNNVVVRLPGWDRRPWMFWPVQAMNLGAGVYLLAFGVPGFEGPLRIANWMLGLLFIWHTISNNNRLLKVRASAKQADANIDQEKRAAIAAALARGAEEEARQDNAER